MSLFTFFLLSFFSHPELVAKLLNIPERIVGGFNVLLNMMSSNFFVNLPEYEKKARDLFLWWQEVSRRFSQKVQP